MSKKKESTEAGFQSVENALSKTEQYIEENQRSLSIIVLAIVIVIGGYLGYKKFYLEPNNEEAAAAMFYAQNYFEQDSFRLALEGDGANYGFLDIIDEFGITKSGNLAQLYAGICFFKMGLYEDAIENLKKFDSNDILYTTMALGAIGDSYVELDELETAVSFYIKAAQRKKNEVTTPVYSKKAGLVYEELKEYKKALECYEIILKDYPQSDEGRDIERYIATVKMKI
ncbi:MAG: tetratricopeptide repeat protein [Bacteroidales bacterium]|nr:tetratricopeptide repeat protein [Bacteroidales bacterium]